MLYKCLATNRSTSYTIQHNINLTTTTLPSSEVRVVVRQPLGATGKQEEVNLQFRAKGSLSLYVIAIEHLYSTTLLQLNLISDMCVCSGMSVCVGLLCFFESCLMLTRNMMSR